MKNVKNMSDDELSGLTAEIAKESAKRKEEKRQEKREENKIFVKHLIDNPQIADLIKHGRTSCSDANPCNGYDSSLGHARCRKCHLIDIIECEDDNFEISFDVSINHV